MLLKGQRLAFIAKLVRFKSTSKECQKKPTAKKETVEKFERKSVRVAILGAASETGRTLALLLKQNQILSHIFMYDKTNTAGIAGDLKHVDTRCAVTGFNPKELVAAIRNADIIVLLGQDLLAADVTLQDILKQEGERVIQLATACAVNAPKAILVDCACPISVTLPLVSELYRRNHWYHPGRVIGSVSLLQIRLNTLLARYQTLDPTSVHVPLIGGPEVDTVVPLFSRSTPSAMSLNDAKLLTNRFRGLPPEAEPTAIAKNKMEYCPHANAFAINRLVTTIALGLMGDTRAISTAHVRSNFATACRHIVSTVKFGATGVVHNYGVPRLTGYELKMFEKTCLELSRREQLGTDYLALVESNRPTNATEATLINKIFNAPKKQKKEETNYTPACQH